MLDIRYHLVSLVAVFLALALGVLLGTLVGGRGTLAERQDALIEGIQADIGKVQTENRTLQDQAKTDKSVTDAFFAALIKDQLAGRRVAFVSTAVIPPEIVSALTDVMSQAGAESVFIRFREDFGRAVVKRKKVFEPFLDQNLPAEDPKNAVLRRLVSEILASTDDGFTKALTTQKLAATSDPRLQADFVVFFAASDEKDLVLEGVHGALIVDAEEVGLSVAAVELSTADVSHMVLYQKAGISTVDNIETLTGQVALVHIIGGRFGNYGSKPSAVSPLPSFVQ
ncbi:MAG: copper transporter [Terriglobia bacterium]